LARERIFDPEEMTTPKGGLFVKREERIRWQAASGFFKIRKRQKPASREDASQSVEETHIWKKNAGPRDRERFVTGK